MEGNVNIVELIEKLKNLHHPAGPLYRKLHQLQATETTENNELESIYHLIESHVPGLRQKTILRYEKILTSTLDNSSQQLSLSKNCVDFNCTHSKIEDNVKCMLQKLQEMPKEWTLVQITPKFNTLGNLNADSNKFYTSSLYISVLNCGENQMPPFCVYVDVPRDSVSGEVVELAQEIHSIIAKNKEILMAVKNRGLFRNLDEKSTYFSGRCSIDQRLKSLVKDLQDLYLKEWRCLLIGKYIDQQLELKINTRIRTFFDEKVNILQNENKTLSIVSYLVKGSNYLKAPELKRAVQYLFPHEKSIQKNLIAFIKELSEELSLSSQKKYPVILIIDDTLDCFPWEMMDVLINEPVSRLPSFHFAYALFNEHKDSLKNGFKIVENPSNGKFIINPDLDLQMMQNRITSFIEYWIPTWTGLSGYKPSIEQFEEMLTSGEIFSYNGHGSGNHFLSMEKIQKLRVNAVVLLFGCGSTKLIQPGPQTEFYGTYQMYMIACSPCIVGMLWEVTDLDTDILTTEFMSQWIPNENKSHWKNLDKTIWKKGGKVNLSKENVIGESINYHEPELLRALSLSKKANLSFYVTKAACVARGIPVKIKT